MKAVFIIGKQKEEEEEQEMNEINEKVLLEARLHRDILVEDFIDHYTNLTIKSVMMLKFVINQNLKAKYVFKVRYELIMNLFCNTILPSCKGYCTRLVIYFILLPLKIRH